MKTRAERLIAVVAAQRSADQGRLAACLAQQLRLKEAAGAHFEAVRGVPPGKDAADMIIATSWQEHQRALGNAALANAAEMDAQIQGLRLKLARSLGREQAVIALAKSERATIRRKIERRLEDTIVAGRPDILRHG